MRLANMGCQGADGSKGVWPTLERVEFVFFSWAGVGIHLLYID